MTTFKGTIDAIRNILRGEGITGMDSINHCLTFLISRCLDKTLCEKLKIPTKYAFENIFKNDGGEELDSQELYAKFYTKADKNCLIYNIVTNVGFKHITFKLVGPDNLQKILLALKKIDISKLSETTDLVGIVYELHLKSGTSNAMRDLGQYFTHRLVIKYMIELCAPKVVNGKVEKIADPSMGTGGFLTMAVKYLNKHNKKIDWSKNKDRIYGFDIDDTVKNMASLNLLLETGELFNHMIKRDTLYEDMKINNVSLDDVDVLLANEPMGLKNIIHANCCDKIKDLKIRGTKAEPLFLQLFMKSLAENGRCAVVVPDGVLFNESTLHQETRKYLVENMNLKKIIILKDKDFFLNTGVSTSILYFVNDGNKTQEVEFIEIRMNKEQTEIIESDVVKVKYDVIKKNNYSLFVNKYVAVDEKKMEGIKYMKLSDICEFMTKSKRNASFGTDEGLYPFYTSSMTPKRCDEADYNKKCIIIGTGGNANIKKNENFSCSADNFVLSCNNDTVLLDYIFYYLLINMNILENGFSGSTIKHISKDYVQQIEIPIPSLEIQKQIVEQLDTISENNKTCEKGIEELTKIMKYYVKVHTADGEEKKLGDICEFKAGNFNTKNMTNSGTIPFYNASVKNPIGYNDDFCFDGDKYILFVKSGGNEKNKISDTHALGLSLLVKGKTAAVSDVLKITLKDTSLLSYEYLLYYLMKVKPDIQGNAHYTTGLGHCDMNYVKNIKINVQSTNEQAEIVKYCDKLSSMIRDLQNQINENNTLMKDIFAYYLKTKDVIVDNEAVNENNNEQIADDIEVREDVKSVDDKPQIKQNNKSTSDKKLETKSIISSIKTEQETKSDESKPTTIKKKVVVKGKKTGETQKEATN